MFVQRQMGFEFVWKMVKNRIAGKSMKKWVFFGMNTLGWLMIFVVLLMLAVYGVASDNDLYYQLQLEAGVPDSAGISAEDLRFLDKWLSLGLFAPLNTDTAYLNPEIEVFGKLQRAYNDREITHLYDCRRLISPIQPGSLYFLLLAPGIFLICCGGKRYRSGRLCAAWIALALMLLPLGIFGIWAAIDFDAAFTFFHRLLFSNDLWLLNPQTDLLIRICPQSMFEEMGMRIALRAGIMLLGVPLLLTILKLVSDRRKRKIRA